MIPSRRHAALLFYSWQSSRVCSSHFIVCFECLLVAHPSSVSSQCTSPPRFQVEEEEEEDAALCTWDGGGGGRGSSTCYFREATLSLAVPSLNSFMWFVGGRAASGLHYYYYCSVGPSYYCREWMNGRVSETAISRRPSFFIADISIFSINSHLIADNWVSAGAGPW